MLAWSSIFNLVDKIIGTYTVSVILKRGDFEFLCTGVYGPQDDIGKLNFIHELKTIGVSYDLPWIIVGDFNLLRSANDTTG